MTITGEDILVDINAVVVTTEYLVSNPTGAFNLSMPHKLKKVASYQQMSYGQFVEFKYNAAKDELKKKLNVAKGLTEDRPDDVEPVADVKAVAEVEAELEKLEEEKEDPLDVMFWSANKKEAATVIAIFVSPKEKVESFSDKIRCKITIKPREGVAVPVSGFQKESIDHTSPTLMGHYELTAPGTEIDSLDIHVETELIKAVKTTYTSSNREHQSVGFEFPSINIDADGAYDA